MDRQRSVLPAWRRFASGGLTQVEDPKQADKT